MKIALIGYGHMGKELERFIQEEGKHAIVSISFRNEKESLDIKGIKQADIAIDFTAADVVVSTIEQVARLGVNMVVGTTGWYDKLIHVEKIVKEKKVGFVYAKNFSLGANIFFQIVGFAANLFSRYGNYDVAGLEMHHTGKKDSPSGTAKKLASIIMENFPKKKKLETGRLDRQIKEDELHFASVRTGRYFGHHEIMFDSASDEIKLTHTAHSRRGFAEGVLFAAEFIKGKKGLFNFEEVFKREIVT